MPYESSYYDIFIDDYIEPQQCKACVSVISSEEMSVCEDFGIDVPPSFGFRINLCGDLSCAERSKIFLAGETVYISYESEAESPDTEVLLIYPDDEEKMITLPYEFVPEQTGTYIVKAKASKQGFKKSSAEERFGVMDKSPSIIDARICDVDGVCSGQENLQNCPQDCHEKPQVLSDNYTAVLLVVVAIVIFSLVALRGPFNLNPRNK